MKYFTCGYHADHCVWVFVKGWKNESLIKEYQDGRVIMVGPDDHPLHLKKVLPVYKHQDINACRVVIKSRGPGIFPGY